jgi:hypothetical protein
MTDTQIAWLFYGLFLAVRIPANWKRCRLPMVRGSGYFFSVRVAEGFYDGPGRSLLRNYRVSIFLPFLLDAVALPILYLTDRPQFLYGLAFIDMILAFVNHLAAAKRGIRAAKRYELEAAPVASSVVLPLTPRRVQDYTNNRIEWLIAGINIGGLYLGLRNLPEFVRAPILFLYLQVGLLLIKRALVAGRTALPGDHTAAYLAWREGYRRLFLKTCDALRLLLSACLVLVALDVERIYLVVGSFAMAVIWSVWYSRASRGVLDLYVRTPPVRMPEPLEPQTAAPFLLCYRPDTPLSFLKSARGWALNLGNRRTQIGMLYAGGLAALWIRL